LIGNDSGNVLLLLCNNSRNAVELYTACDRLTACYRHGLQHLCEILEYIYTAAAVDIIRVNEKKILYIERVDTSNSTSIGLYIYSTVCIRDRKHLMCEIVCEEDKGRATF
jgi:hypothetical protein